MYQENAKRRGIKTSSFHMINSDNFSILVSVWCGAGHVYAITKADDDKNIIVKTIQFIKKSYVRRGHAPLTRENRSSMCSYEHIPLYDLDLWRKCREKHIAFLAGLYCN